ncbi:BadM/Rrf2 family transcriptional regulator [Paraburkholderia sp. BL6669N2]|uniref:Rrf2 family transcriptional regulator n=1 Tax=Paraburkholderia sp. BL6669N2 TaxID=1938807 RepID=UPI000E22E5EF|nr:Rrf2 family transcriptional regulator [Paraburkholderia sp. BL6669N2]REG59295.1 BadM/Rrf2 family transcriptional regulator [Paraburkholderia sp. BL6669N2]
MRTDSRMSRTLHALIHMAHAGGPLTSETLAEMLATNAVVVRRMFGGLRDAGYVQSEKGHGGGWVLVTPLEEITLLDVYRAVGEPPLFSDLVSEDRPECLIEQAVNAHLSATLGDARAAVLAKFAKVTLAMLSSGFKDASSRKKNPTR